MRLFHHQQGAADVPVPGLAETAAALGWQPAPDQPFDRELHDALYDLACDMYGIPGGALEQGLGRNWHGIGFHDAFRFSDAGRTVTVANGRGVARRTRDLLDLVDVIPSSVVPHQVDRSVDDLAERIARIKSVEDAITILQGLGDGDGERLARSDTPLAGFADVRTPQEAMTRFQALAPARRMQLLGLFMRASGGD